MKTAYFIFTMTEEESTVTSPIIPGASYKTIAGVPEREPFATVGWIRRTSKFRIA